MISNFKSWLKLPNVTRMVLVEVADVTNSIGNTINLDTYVTRRMSTHPITVAGNEYLPVISKVDINESISIDYATNINSIDVELNNSTGELDNWLSNIWTNKKITVYVGAYKTSYPNNALASSIDNNSEFQRVFTGYVDNIDSRSRSRINIKARDVLQIANTTVKMEVLGNYYQGSITSTSTYVNPYATSLKPLVFGEVNNIAPLLIDASTLQYMVSDTEVERIIEVRDNGVPVQFSTSPSYPGCFKLLKSPAGAVTCSVQGSIWSYYFIPYEPGQPVIMPGLKNGPYTNTAASTIATILAKYVPNFDSTSIDLSSFKTLGQQAVGAYVTSKTNAAVLCQELAKSCGLVITTTRDGKVKLVTMGIPGATPYPGMTGVYYDPSNDPNNTVLDETNTMLNSLQLTKKLDVLAGIRLGYAKNWSVQPNLLTAIPQIHKDLLGTEWQEAVYSDETVKTRYGVSTETELESTYLVGTNDANMAAYKKAELFGKPRKVYAMKLPTEFMFLEPGTGVVVYGNRFGLQGEPGRSYQVSTYGLVISTKPDWIKGTIDIEVLV